jgi:hypothetical protein
MSQRHGFPFLCSAVSAADHSPIWAACRRGSYQPSICLYLLERAQEIPVGARTEDIRRSDFYLHRDRKTL